MYEQEIQKVLTDVGQRGISVKALTKHVYNMSSTLFCQPDFAEVQQAVRQFLQRHSRAKSGLVECTGKRGCYRLRMEYYQQMLRFLDDEPAEPPQPETPSPDLSLSLFDDF